MKSLTVCVIEQLIMLPPHHQQTIKCPGCGREQTVPPGKYECPTCGHRFTGPHLSDDDPAILPLWRLVLYIALPIIAFLIWGWAWWKNVTWRLVAVVIGGAIMDMWFFWNFIDHRKRGEHHLAVGSLIRAIMFFIIVVSVVVSWLFDL